MALRLLRFSVSLRQTGMLFRHIGLDADSVKCRLKHGRASLPVGYDSGFGDLIISTYLLIAVEDTHGNLVRHLGDLARPVEIGGGMRFLPLVDLCRRLADLHAGFV